MNTTIAIAIGAGMGVLLASMGYSVDSWQWWAVMLLMNGYGLALAL